MKKGTTEESFSVVFSYKIALALCLALLNNVEVSIPKWAPTGSHET